MQTRTVLLHRSFRDDEKGIVELQAREEPLLYIYDFIRRGGEVEKVTSQSNVAICMTMQKAAPGRIATRLHRTKLGRRRMNALSRVLFHSCNVE